MPKLWIKSILFLFIVLSLNSCFVLETTPSEYDKQQEIYLDKKTKAKDSIKLYLSQNIIQTSKYKPYDYSDLYELKPKEIEEYEKLILERKRLPLLENTYHGQLEQKEKELDSAIAQKKQYIKENKIYTTYEMGHIYSLTNTEGVTTVTEQIFYFYPNFSIKNLNTSYYLQLNNFELEFYERFLFNRPLFSSYNTYQDDINDSKFYNNLKKELDKRIDKNSFLYHCITLTSIAYNQEYLEPNFTCQQIAKKHLSKSTGNNVEILGAKLLQSTSEGISSDSNSHYTFLYETTVGNYEVHFNEFLEVVEISER